MPSAGMTHVVSFIQSGGSRPIARSMRLSQPVVSLKKPFHTNAEATNGTIAGR